MKFVKNSLSLLFICLFWQISLPAQTAAPTPAQTGKSYDTGEIKRPSTTAPQFPSPVSFTDITAQTLIDFRHNASPTSIKYLPETMSAESV